MTNGCIPKAPDGGHRSHAGTLLEVAAVAVADDPPEVADALLDDPPELAGGDGIDPGAALGALDRVLAAPPAVPKPAVEVPDVDPVAVAPVAAAPVDAADVDWADVAGFPDVVVVTAGVVVGVPRVTVPPLVTLPGVAAVCAKAGNATAIENSIMCRSNCAIGKEKQDIAAPVKAECPATLLRQTAEPV